MNDSGAPVGEGLIRAMVEPLRHRGPEDIFELFDYRRRKARNIHLLIRARYNRCLDNQPVKLFDHLQALPVMGEAQIEIPRQRERKGKPSKPGRIGLPVRKARVQLRWDKVTIAAPARPQTRHLPAIELHALLVVESDPPKGAKAVRWVEPGEFGSLPLTPGLEAILHQAFSLESATETKR